MKVILTFIVFSLSLGLNAQSKKEKKLLELYAKGKFEKSESLAKKILAKDRKNIPALYISGLLLLNEAKESSSPSSSKRLVIKSIDKRNKMVNQTSVLYLQLNDSIHTYLIILAENSNLKKKYTTSYLKLLAKEFNDTLAAYYTINQTFIAPKVEVDYSNLSSDDSLRKVMLNFAQTLEGTPYKWAGETPKGGFDCSGFTMYVFKSIGIDLPHNAQKQSELIRYHKSLENAKPGDMVFFGSFTKDKFNTQHAGIIYSKEGDDIKVIHCVSNGVNIEGKDSSWEYHWKDRVLFVVDVISEKEKIEAIQSEQN